MSSSNIVVCTPVSSLGIKETVETILIPQIYFLVFAKMRKWLWQIFEKKIQKKEKRKKREIVRTKYDMEK